MSSDSVDPSRIGRNVMDVWSAYLQRALEARRRHRDASGQFFDAYFDDAVADPIGLLDRAYTHFGLELTDAARRRMEAFLAANPRGSRGAHRYVLEDFDLDLHEIRACFADYCSEFGVPLAA